jgi:hypothetical protein
MCTERKLHSNWRSPADTPRLLPTVVASLRVRYSRHHSSPETFFGKFIYEPICSWWEVYVNRGSNVYVCEDIPIMYTCSTCHTTHKDYASILFWAYELIIYDTHFHRHLLPYVIIHPSQWSAQYSVLMQLEEICLYYCIVYFLYVLSLSFIRNLISFQVHN